MSEQRKLRSVEGVTVGGLGLSKHPDRPGRVRIVHVGGPREGEGGEFSEEKLEQHLLKFYEEHF